MNNVQLPNYFDELLPVSWKEHLSAEFEKEYWKKLTNFVQSEYTNGAVYPRKKDVFVAFDLCPIEHAKVVIVGQDPYHGVGQAHGLAFSVPNDVAIPPSLKNIYKELRDDCNCNIPQSGNLTKWAQQGVLLLNATLTVREGEAGSHSGKGWERFTDVVLERISQNKERVVFILWGRYAQQKQKLIDKAKHCVLTATHPSPLSAHNGFFGCQHFSKTNIYLLQCGQRGIDWCAQ